MPGHHRPAQRQPRDEINPRPETNLPVEFAFANLERRLLASGVTTEFHAISFMNTPSTGRSVSAPPSAPAPTSPRYAAIGRRPVDHQVLHRLDVWSPDDLDTIFASVERMPVRYVSINDHTPGQGQYRDLDGYKERMEASRRRRRHAPLDVDGMLETIADARRRHRDGPGGLRAHPRRARAAAARSSPPTTTIPPRRSTSLDLGARVAEFPVTFERRGGRASSA